MADFLKRDNKGVVRIVHIELMDNGNDTFSIVGYTGTLKGKKIPRPIITIDRGKVKRSVKEQASLQFNSICSDYLDKGYKEALSLSISDITDAEKVEDLVPKINTDSKGALKPMLAKQTDGVSEKVWNTTWKNKEWYASRKLDGTRCLMFYKDGEVHTTSRGGKDYDVATKHIRTSKWVKEYFSKYPDSILDGELYIHGYPLSYISGLVRLKDFCEKHESLEYWVYDLVDETMPFKERLAKLDILKTAFSDSKIQYVPHILVKGKQDIMSLHNQWIQEGYEGLVLRDPDEPYKCGARDWRMCKVKIFQDDEFKILDIVDGLRDEDMCFLMQTKQGYTFKAKPMGDRSLKQWYRENIDQIRNKMGTVKFFGYTNTEEPVPNLPVFKALRDNFDI